MNILFGGKVVSCRQIRTTPGRVRIGDLILFNHALVKVKTVQPACPYIENPNHYFTALVVETATGETEYVRTTDAHLRGFRP